MSNKNDFDLIDAVACMIVLAIISKAVLYVIAANFWGLSIWGFVDAISALIDGEPLLPYHIVSFVASAAIVIILLDGVIYAISHYVTRGKNVIVEGFSKFIMKSSVNRKYNNIFYLNCFIIAINAVFFAIIIITHNYLVSAIVIGVLGIWGLLYALRRKHDKKGST